MTRKIYSIFLIALLCSVYACTYNYRVQVIPDDAEVFIDGKNTENPSIIKSDGKNISVYTLCEGYVPFLHTYSHNSFLSPTHINIQMEKIKYNVTLDAVQENVRFSIDNEPLKPLPFQGLVSHDNHLLTLRGEDGFKVSFPLKIKKPGDYLFRLQEKPLFMHQIGIYACGCAPKQVDFTLDNKYLYVPLLGGGGFQIFDIDKKEIINYIYVGQWYRKSGFVEGLFIEKYQCYFVSQMNTARIFEYAIKDEEKPVYKRTLWTEGVWSKVIAYSEPLDLLAVSNWCSHDVSIMEYKTGKVVKKLKNLVVPRGLAFSHDGKFLYVASFEGGFFLKFATDTWEEIGRIYKKTAAMRHIRVSPDDKTVFVSNMYHYEVYQIDADSFKIMHAYKVFNNPNTIEINKDARILFVSCRGPNNPENYTLRSPKDGKVMVFDTVNMELLTIIQGGNQPTGLDLSHDDNLLAFSNFKDNTLELYDISDLKLMLALKDRDSLFPLNLFSFWKRIGEDLK